MLKCYWLLDKYLLNQYVEKGNEKKKKHHFIFFFCLFVGGHNIHFLFSSHILHSWPQSEQLIDAYCNLLISFVNDIGIYIKHVSCILQSINQFC